MKPKDNTNRGRKTVPKSIPGRKELAIDEAIVANMAGDGSTNDEIAEFLDISTDTLRRRCANVLRLARGEFKKSLRRRQFEVAKAGNVQMLIWLGKQILGQKERVDVVSEDATVVKRLYGVAMSDLGEPGAGIDESPNDADDDEPDGVRSTQSGNGNGNGRH